MNGRAFDAQVVLTKKNSRRGKLMSQYVCLRVTSMEGVNLNHFRFDRHNALFFFLMNPNGHIYMRYGGRDQESADTYLNLRSLELALGKGLELHKRYQPNDKEVARLKSNPLYAKDIPGLAKRTVNRGRCVECHLIADYQVAQLAARGKLDRRKALYQSPDIKKLGIYLDIPKGLKVKEVNGAAKKAGLLPNDVIQRVQGEVVWTLADFQYVYDQVDRDEKQISLTVVRDEKKVDLTISLPSLWWEGDISFRHWTEDPIVYYDSEPLSSKEKESLKLPENGFASRVTHVEMLAELSNFHQLKKGDVIFEVDGKKVDPIANTAKLFIKLYVKSGAIVKLKVLRDKKIIEMELFTGRRQFRK